MHDTPGFYGPNGIFNGYSLTPMAAVRNDRHHYILMSEDGGAFTFKPKTFTQMVIVFQSEDDAAEFDRRLNQRSDKPVKYTIRDLKDCSVPATEPLILVKPVENTDTVALFVTCPKCGQQEFIINRQEGRRIKLLVPIDPDDDRPQLLLCEKCKYHAPVEQFPRFPTAHTVPEETTDHDTEPE